ncbi:glycosyltransferase family A protein [Kineosporia sp. NBRC 101731]|uniref:glycosyltransferase n=1 Tax=Kineosporia sp. NBRC 101731 TaxID=3032199 RepID=UPI0024A4BFB9|nr:glycosyltransferase family A protein [Kineosporia sp. NBRC 101731]GLY30205.1 glycosyl transferase [Kineosporia sp. NBRC 101731]
MTGGLPTLSVVICCRNSASTLAGTLESVAAQEYPGWWETVVVDNGSRDATVEVAQGFAGRLPNLRVLRVPEPGFQAAALNHGIAQSTGEVIVFVDSDDLTAAGYLEKMARVLAAVPYAGGELEVGRLNPPPVRARRDLLQSRHIDVFCDYRPAVVGASMGVRREAIARVGGFDEALPTQHDLDLSWRLAEAGVPATFVPGAVLHYRYRPGSRETFWQERGYGLGEVVLYRKFRARGMPGRSPRQAVGSWARVLFALPGALSPAGRARLATVTGKAVGRLEGSLKHRTSYL